MAEGEAKDLFLAFGAQNQTDWEPLVPWADIFI
jgi:hypothetical protein